MKGMTVAREEGRVRVREAVEREREGVCEETRGSKRRRRKRRAIHTPMAAWAHTYPPLVSH